VVAVAVVVVVVLLLLVVVVERAIVSVQMYWRQIG
jgi:hypothetical protein